MSAREAFARVGLDVRCEDAGDCTMCYTKKNSEIIVITIERGKEYYAKIIPFEKIPPNPTCEAAYMTPHGLYAFAESLDDLAKRVAEKLGRLI